jgi:5-formyltetrahydrofolate cyclo-ligase
MAPHESKARLRERLRPILASQNAAARIAAGEAIVHHFARWALEGQFDLSKGVALFKHLSDEIDTGPLDTWLVAKQIRRFVPDANAKDFSLKFVEVPSDVAVSQFDSRGGRPIDSHEIGLVLVPGLAFDKSGKRLGRGHGYYDRFLESFKTLPHDPLTMGLALDCQVIEQIPVDSHDQSVDMLCSPALGVLLTS